MKRAYLICVLQCLTAIFVWSQSNPVLLINPRASEGSRVGATQADPKAQARTLDQYGKLPLSFEVNQGQTDGRVKFLSRTSEYSLFLTADEAVLTLSSKQPKKSSSDTPEQVAKKPGFISGYRFSDTASSSRSDAPSGAERRTSKAAPSPALTIDR
jgi:hypothetical protein